jgi:hypothetical protein
MNLAQGDQGPEFLYRTFSREPTSAIYGSEFKKERFAIPLDGGLVIFFGETEVERASTVSTGESARAGRKSMDEPGEFVQL